MKPHRVLMTTVLAAAALLAVAMMPPPLANAQRGTVPVVSLKAFTSVTDWTLDITWHAKDAFEDEDRTATLDMTATARLYLKQSDKQDGWGRWHVEKVYSANLALAALLVNKHDHSRTEYRPASPVAADGGATFQVGGLTPGYQLDCSIAYPAKLSNPLLGTMDSLVTLLTTDISGAAPVFLTGPLPPTGTTIHGSAVIPMEIPPFGTRPIPRTRMGIQFVLQELPLAPLVPTKKK